MTTDVFEKDATSPRSQKSRKWFDYDLRTTWSKETNNPAVFMWSIGNEQEANGNAHSLATVKRLVKVIKDVDTTLCIMGADKFRFGDGSDDHGRLLMNWMRLVSTTQKTTTRNSCEASTNWLIYGSETSSQQPVWQLLSSWTWIENIVRTWNVITNSLTMVMTELTGVKRQQIAGWTALSGQVRTISVKWHHGTTKTKLPLRIFGIVDTAGIPRHDLSLPKPMVSVMKKPMVHLLPHWNWENRESRMKKLKIQTGKSQFAYSNAASVELFWTVNLSELRSLTKQTSDGRTYQEGANAMKSPLSGKVA